MPALLPMLQLATAFAGAPEGAPDVESLLRAGLRERYPTVVRWEIRPFGGDMKAAAGDASVVSLGSRSAVRIGRQVYWYAVEGFQQVVQATRSARPGEALDARAGRIAEADVLAVSCEPLTDPARLDGARAKRTLRADQVICGGFIEPRPPVARGENVTVRYVGMRVSLITRGVAESDGKLGDLVRVKKVDARDSYGAVVSGVGEVTINE